jgi:predicted amidohydrolase
MAPPLKVGLAQIRILPGDKKANVAAILEAVGKAARARCDVLVLPECALAGWLSPAARFAAEPVPGPLTRKLAALARRHRMAIVAGLEERDGERIYNAAVFLDEEGRLLLRHRKVAELAIGLELYDRGTSLGVASWRDRTIAVDICADSWGPEITDALYLMGARVIFSPCAWAVRPGGEETNLAWIREAYRARTRGKELTIAAANGVGPLTQGPWAGRVLQGNSLVVGPDGRTLLEGPTHEVALLTAAV